MRRRDLPIVLGGAATLLAVSAAYAGCAVGVDPNAASDSGVTAPDGSKTDTTVTCPNAAGCPCDPTKALSSPGCYEGPTGTSGVGACRTGTHTCDNGVVSACKGQVVPKPETCNGIDDNCNGKIDDVALDGGVIGTFQDAGYTCTTSLSGVCQYGNLGCSDGGGGAACMPFIDPGSQVETCNNLDDDCNGQVDDGISGSQCTVPNVSGACAVGAMGCTAGVETCQQTVFGTAEKCNKKDDNCNGQVDEGTSLQLCGSSFLTCSNGVCIFICPFVFSSDGDKFVYETSVGGASVYGRKVHLKEGKSVEFEPMWARLDHVVVKNGALDTKLIAAEDEIVYFDDAKLHVIDHEPGVEILSSSSVQWNILGAQDPGETYALRTSALRAPLQASWMGRADVTKELGDLDRHAAPYDLHQANYYDLDFGPVADKSHARIVIDGWKYKEPRHLAAGVPHDHPRLEIRQPDGTYKNAMALSTPRGDQKPVTFDLSSLTFPTGRYELRLVTGTHEDGNAMWYVDRVRLTEDAPRPIAIHELPLSSALLSFMGPPTQLDSKDHGHPRIALDDGRGPLLPEQRTWGAFTRYGDVRDLLRAPDDRMVIMRRGDGVTMHFQGIPAAAHGLEQTVFLETDLLFKPRRWIEDSAPSTLTENVEPLPYHGMGKYPPPAPFPDDDAHRSYVKDDLTRVYEKGDPRWGK